MSGTSTRDPFMALCPDGRLIPIDNGVYFHPYPMATPVNGLALQHAMNAGRQAFGPAFFLDAEALRDAAALETVQRVVRDLLDGLGAGARITTVAPDRPDRTVEVWQKAADMVGVPITVIGAPRLETSARVVRTGDTVNVLPRGQIAMRAVLTAAAELAADREMPAWTRLERLITQVAEARDVHRVPRSGSVSGAEFWRAGYQLAAGLVLGPPPGTDAAALAGSGQPITVETLIGAFTRQDGEAVTDPAELARTLLGTPGGRALVHTPDRDGRPARVRWLAAHDGALWWVDLAADPDDALSAYDPADPAHTEMLAGAGTTVRVITPAGQPEQAGPRSGSRADQTPLEQPRAGATRSGSPRSESLRDASTSLVDALTDLPLGRRAAGTLQTGSTPATTPGRLETRPRPAPGGGVTTGTGGPEDLVRTEIDAVAAGLRDGTPEQQFNALDDLLGNRLPPIRGRFHQAWTTHDGTVRTATAAIAVHDARLAELTRLLDALATRSGQADLQATTATTAHSAALEERDDLRVRLGEATEARDAARRAAHQAANRPPAQPADQAADLAANQAANHAAHQAAIEAANRAVADADRAVTMLTDRIAALEKRLPGLRTAEQEAIDHAAGLRSEIATLTAEQARTPGLRDVETTRRDRAVADRATAEADRALLDAHLTFLRGLAADWAALELGDLRRLAERMDATEAPGAALRQAAGRAATAVGDLFTRDAALTAEDVGRLAYLAYLDGVRRDAEQAHASTADTARGRVSAHVDRLAGYTGTEAADGEAARLAYRSVDLDLWNTLAARFDAVQAGAEQARADAIRAANDELARAGQADRRPDLATVAARAMGVPAGRDWRGESAGAQALRTGLAHTAGQIETLGVRIELATAPSAPWFLRERHLLGDSYVRRAKGAPDAEVQALTGLIRPHLGTTSLPWRSPDKGLTQWLTAQLGSAEVTDWERLIESGTAHEFNGRYVRVFVRPRNPEYRPATQQPAEGVLELQLRLTERGFTRSAGGAHSWNMPLGLTFVMGVANEVMQALIGPIGRFFMGGSRRWAEATGTRISADNFGFAGDWGMHEYGVDAQVVVEVDGTEVATRDLADHLVLRVPKMLSTDRDAVDPSTVGEPMPVRNPGALQAGDHVVNAVDFEDPLAGLQEALRTDPAFGLSATHAARVIDRLRQQMMNQRRAKEHNQWWSSNSWVSPHIMMSAGRGRNLDGHLRAGGTLIDLRRMITTPDAMIRNDMVTQTIRLAGRGASSQAGRRVGFEFPLSVDDHLVLPRVDVGFLTTERAVDRNTTTESLARNTMTRKGKLTRYVATLATDLTLDANLGQLSVRRNTTIEFAVPEEYAAVFEQQIMATPGLREAFHSPKDTVVTPSTPGPRAFSRRGARTPGDLRVVAEKHLIEIVLPAGHVRDGRWAWAEDHRNVRFSTPDDAAAYPAVEDVPDFRYQVDPAALIPVLGATVFTKGTVHGRPEVVSAEYVVNPAHRRTATAAPNGRAPAPATEPWGARGVKDPVDLFLLAKKGPIEVAVRGRATAPTSLSDLPRSLAGLFPVRDNILLRADGVYPATEEPAAFRYLFDERGLVIGAIPLRAAEDGTVTPGELVPNPALYLPRPVAGPVPPDRALASVRAFLDGLNVPGYAQAQLTERVPPAIVDVLAADPRIEVVLATGERLPRQTLPATAPVAAADGTIPPIPSGVRRHVVSADGWVNGDLAPLSGPAREPWALATRSGLGPGVMMEMPGAELIFADVLLLVQQQMKSVGRKLKKGARQSRFFELALKYGVPGMRGQQRSLFDGGITDTYTVGGYTFHVNLTGAFGALRDVTTVPDFLIDTRNVGRSSYNIRQALARRFGARVDIAGRVSVKDFFGIRIKLADLQLMLERERAVLSGLAQSAGRRRKITGTATEFNYDVNYQLTVAVTNKKGKLLKTSSRAYAGADFWAPVRVGEEDLAPAPGGTHSLAPPLPATEAISRLTAAEARAVQQYLDGGDPPGLVSAVDAGTEGQYVWLNRVGALAETLQRFIDGVDRRRTAAATGLSTLLADLAPGGGRTALEEGVSSGITPDFLEAHADKLMTRTGFVVPLARTGGVTRQLRLHLVPANPRFTRPTDTASQRDYQEAGGQAGASVMRGNTLQATFGPGGIFQFGSGAAAPPGAESAQGSNYATQSGPAPGESLPAASRGADHVNINIDLAAARQRTAAESAQVGGRETSRSLYKGRSYSHSADAIFVVSYEQFSRGTLKKERFDLKIKHGMEMSTPDVLAKELGLPIPAADAAPTPARTGTLTPLHRELAFAASTVENVTASAERQVTSRGVTRTVTLDTLSVVTEQLRAMKVNMDDPAIANAVENLFRTSSLKSHSRALRRDGIFQLITLNRALGGVRRIGIRLTARHGPLRYHRPRPDAKGTVMGISIGTESRTEALSHTVKAGVTGDAKFGAGPLRMGVGTGAEAEWGRKHADTTGNTDLFVQRVSPADLGSQEFRADTEFDLEFYEDYDLPQAFSSLADGASWTGKVVDTLTDGRLRAFFQSTFTGAARPERTSRLHGETRLLTPSHLTVDTAHVEAAPQTRTTPLPADAASLPAPTLWVFNGNPPAAGPADLADDLAVTALLAPDLQALEIFNFDTFVDWLPSTRQPGAERYDTTATPPRIPGYGPMSNAATTVRTALNSENVTPSLHRLLAGDYVVKGFGRDEFTVRAVLRTGRWLTRGGYVKTNVPLKVLDMMRQREQKYGASVRPIEVDMGPKAGDAKLVGGTNPALGLSGVDGSGTVTTGLSIDVDKRWYDYDYFWFDVTLIGTSANGRSWVRSDIPYGVLARLPAEKATEIFALRPRDLGIVDHALSVALGDIAAPIGDRRFLVDRLAARPATTAPNLLHADELAAAVQRVSAWTSATQAAPRPAGAPAPAVPAEDCVIRAFGAFVAVHRRTANATTDTEGIGHRGADDLATSLRGEFFRLRDADMLWRYVSQRPGTMLAVRVPPPPGGMSHLFWAMSVGNGEIRWLDGQLHGVSDAPATIGTLRQHLLGEDTGYHARAFRAAGTEVLLLDEHGKPVNLRGALPGVLGNREPGDRLGRRSSGQMMRTAPFAPSFDLPAQAGKPAPALTPVREVREVRAAPDREVREAPDRTVREAPDREVRALGDFSGAHGRETLRRITEAARGSDGPPVVAISLGGDPETALAAVRQLDEMLRNDAWRGRLPVVAATSGTKRSEDAFAQVRRVRRPVTVHETAVGFDRVWQLLEPGAEQAVTLQAEPTVALFARADAIPPAPVRTLTPVLAGWIATPDWAGAEAYHREHPAELHASGLAAELARVIAENPADRRLPGLQLARETGARAGGVPESRLTPVAVSMLDVEPPYDAARSGPVPPTFIYDYLRSAGRSRRERFPLDGLLLQLMLADQLRPEQALTLARTASVTRVDRANTKIFEVVAELRALDGSALLADPAGQTARFTALVGAVSRVRPGALPEDCLDPVDRAAWVGRLDALRDRWRAAGDRAGLLRAEVLEAVTYTLSNC
ncbi:hypothetical protein ACIA8K_04005 [Catenuloplanes sp. NPDC051500]|uniref:hypothetical protein n=1 Tax=Catenuloplanes sp. NPDC051500 TaxID=3363959 RepID=UPI0037A980C2